MYREGAFWGPPLDISKGSQVPGRSRRERRHVLCKLRQHELNDTSEHASFQAVIIPLQHLRQARPPGLPHGQQLLQLATKLTFSFFCASLTIEHRNRSLCWCRQRSDPMKALADACSGLSISPCFRSLHDTSFRPLSDWPDNIHILEDVQTRSPNYPLVHVRVRVFPSFSRITSSPTPARPPAVLNEPQVLQPIVSSRFFSLLFQAWILEFTRIQHPIFLAFRCSAHLQRKDRERGRRGGVGDEAIRW